MLEAIKSLRDLMLSFKKDSESDVVKTSDSAKAGASNQPYPIPTQTSISRTSDHSDVQPMDISDFYGPPLPSKSSQNIQSEHASKQSNVESNHLEHHSESEHPKKVCPKPKKHSDKRKHKVQAKYYSQSSSEEEESSAQLKSLLNLNIRLLKSLNIRIARIQSFTGK